MKISADHFDDDAPQFDFSEQMAVRMPIHQQLFVFVSAYVRRKLRGYLAAIMSGRLLRQLTHSRLGTKNAQKPRVR
ncbi:hypothetical protein [Methylobacterium oxalidis]|uniref:hypothetical protein n=1 Tax=Methylobacterium oxalidis TaxID=944322 RepID=UPI0011BF61F3|nr:hypothetical protein [Methylobacterium oxalidis]